MSSYPIVKIILSLIVVCILFLRARNATAKRWVYIGVTSSMGVAFLVAMYIANQLPSVHRAQIPLRVHLIRGSVLITGLVFLILVLGASVPLLLNTLERVGFARFVGARHIRATKSGFLTVISILSICGVAVSSCALGSVISIMGGFGADLKRKILANNAHIVIDSPSPSGFESWQPTLEQIRSTPGVIAATPVVTGEVLASVGNTMNGVLLRGIDPESIGHVIDLPKNVEIGKFEWLLEPKRVANLSWSERKGVDWDDSPLSSTTMTTSNTMIASSASLDSTPDSMLDKSIQTATVTFDRPLYPCVLIGHELAKTMHLRLGSELSLVSRTGELTPAGVAPRERKFRVAGIFSTGMYEYDATHAFVTADAARNLLDQPGRIGSIQIKVYNTEQAEIVRAAIEAKITRSDLRVRDWKEMNKNLFSALKLERIATFIVLSIAIIVASFCILCTLLLMVTEKGPEIAILKALGASDSAILRIFMIEGMIVGSIGTLFGVATGYALCYGLSWFGFPINPEIYYIDKLPITVSIVDFSLVALSALAICGIATIYPARAASKLTPIEGLRYE